MIYYTTEDVRKVTLLPDPRITDKNTNLGFTQNFLIFLFFILVTCRNEYYILLT